MNNNNYQLTRHCHYHHHHHYHRGLDKSAFLRDEIVERGGNIDESLVQNLLETGADILSVDEEGQNALHLGFIFVLLIEPQYSFVNIYFLPNPLPLP